MGRRLAPWLVSALIVASLALRGEGTRAAPALRIAITIDDLPPSRALPAGYTPERLIEQLTATLQRHGVRHATGFVIGERVANEPRAAAALAPFQAAGYGLGNHTHSHPALGQLALADFLADVARADPIVRALAPSQAHYFFRFPYLQEGRTPEERRRATHALAALGYLSAPVTIDFFDWSYAEPHASCVALGDKAGREALEARYLQAADAALTWSESAAERLLARSLPHVLLLHANPITVERLDALLTLYERRGAVFVSLAEALADPAYAVESEGGNWLAARARALGQRFSPSAAVPYDPDAPCAEPLRSP